jgi:hypothetical protein
MGSNIQKPIEIIPELYYTNANYFSVASIAVLLLIGKRLTVSWYTAVGLLSRFDISIN